MFLVAQKTWQFCLPQNIVNGWQKAKKTKKDQKTGAVAKLNIVATAGLLANDSFAIT